MLWVPYHASPISGKMTALGVATGDDHSKDPLRWQLPGWSESVSIVQFSEHLPCMKHQSPQSRDFIANDVNMGTVRKGFCLLGFHLQDLCQMLGDIKWCVELAQTHAKLCLHYLGVLLSCHVGANVANITEWRRLTETDGDWRRLWPDLTW